MLAALASVLLASCATSDTDVPFGFAASGLSPVAAQTTDSRQSSLVLGDPAEMEEASRFVMEEGDPDLPGEVAGMPTLRPVSAEEAAALAATQTQPQQDPQEEPATLAQAPSAPTGEPAAQAAGDAQVAAQDGDDAAEQQAVAFAPAEEPKKTGFLASLFGSQPQRPAPKATQPLAAAPAQQQRAAEAAPAARPLIQLASTGQAAKPLVAQAAAAGAGSPLPGVRSTGALFEISRRDGLDDEDDIDLHEGEGLYQVASAAGLARLAPNGLMKQTEHVDVACLKPSLVRVLKSIEHHYGQKVVVTSGYRSQQHNRRARGARNSLHMYCAAADIQVEGVGKLELAQFVRNMPGRGGVGTYCHTDSVHVDVGPERDWNWRCRRRK